jgi:hypothetical protein
MTRRSSPAPRSCDRIPTPGALADAPELAILAALDQTLDLAAAALACEYPELADLERPYWLGSPPRVLTAAVTLLSRARKLQRALRAYRKAVELRRQDDASRNLDDRPF